MIGEPSKLKEGVSAPPPGEIMNYGWQCGMVWGGTLDQLHRVEGNAPDFTCIVDRSDVEMIDLGSSLGFVQ